VQQAAGASDMMKPGSRGKRIAGHADGRFRQYTYIHDLRVSFRVRQLGNVWLQPLIAGGLAWHVQAM
jgi:hypothetical protein